MFEVKENTRVLPDGTLLTTYTREVTGASSIEVEAGTTGFKGGNAGFGGRTYIRVRDLGGTDMFVKRANAKNGNTSEFELYLGGDSELKNMLRALKFVVRVLEDESKEVIDR